MLAGTFAGLYRSADNGVTWQHITNGLPAETYPGSFGVSTIAKTANAYLIGTNKGIFYSLDKGLSWLPTNITARVIGVAANDSVACAALDDDPSFANIYRSVKNPAVWKFAEQAYMMHWKSIASNGKSHFYAGTAQNYNFVSADKGLTWDVLTKGIPLTGGGYAIAAKDNIVFIGNADGIYFSNNYGASFTKENNGFDESHTVQSIALSSDYVYAGIDQSSVWKRPLADFHISKLKEPLTIPLPVTFSPNPLVNKSQLTYSIKTNERVVINLYHANGNLVKHIKDEFENAGSYDVIINKAGMLEENYFLSVRAGKQQSVINVQVTGN